jgi:hypothetical protein
MHSAFTLDQCHWPLLDIYCIVSKPVRDACVCVRALLKARVCSEQEKSPGRLLTTPPATVLASCAARTRAGGEGHEDCDRMEGPCRRCGCPQDDLVVLQDVSICTTATRTHTHTHAHTRTHTHTHTHTHSLTHTHTHAPSRVHSIALQRNSHALPINKLPCTLAVLHARCLTRSLPYTLAALHARCLARSLSYTLTILQVRPHRQRRNDR